MSVDAKDRWSQASALNLIGQAQAAQGEYEEAHYSLQESIALYRRVEDRRGAAQALVNLGNAALEAGQVDQAKAAFLEALPAAEKAQAVATGLSALAGLAKIEADGERPNWAYSLATYVGEHPQASEYSRETARQVCGEIEGCVRGQEVDDTAGRFRGSTFEKVVGIILGENL